MNFMKNNISEVFDDKQFVHIIALFFRNVVLLEKLRERLNEKCKVILKRKGITQSILNLNTQIDKTSKIVKSCLNYFECFRQASEETSIA